MKDGTGTGFRVVAGYIFGKNKARRSREPIKMAMTAPVRTSADAAAPSESEKMAMTAPVRSSGGGRRSGLKISFVLPSKYSKGSAPRPLSPSQLRACCLE